ncbi:hypothetical protein [Streptomyces sp. NPDC021096]
MHDEAGLKARAGGTTAWISPSTGKAVGTFPPRRGVGDPADGPGRS